MRITELKYAKKFNLGNYESEEFGLTAVIEDDDTQTTSSIFQQLKMEVAKAYGGETADEPAPVEAEETEAEETEVEEEAPKKRGRKPKAKAEEVEEEEAEETEAEEVEEEVEEEAEEEVEEEAPKKSAKAKSKFKKKAQVYQRSNETHKELFSNVLKSVAPDWKKTEASKAKAKSASQKMDGKEFLNEEGEVLPAFKAEVKKLMGKK